MLKIKRILKNWYKDFMIDHIFNAIMYILCVILFITMILMFIVVYKQIF